MKNYEYLEKAVLNCFIIDPNLFKKTRLEGKHFKKYSRLFNFLKNFYNKFGTFDISLMGSVCSNPSEAIDYIADIIDTTSVPGRFNLYETQLLKFYNDFNTIEEIHILEHKLYTRELDLEDFKNELKGIFKNENI